MKRPDYYFLDPTVVIESNDDMVRFESRHRLYGAVSREERRAREATPAHREGEGGAVVALAADDLLVRADELGAGAGGEEGGDGGALRVEAEPGAALFGGGHAVVGDELHGSGSLLH